MTLLLDHNLPPRLARSLRNLFPGSTHVQTLGLERADDLEVWQRARADGFVIVTKDSDFNDLGLALGPPPKVVWLRIGNCTRAEAEQAIRLQEEALRVFAMDKEAAVLVVR